MKALAFSTWQGALTVLRGISTAVLLFMMLSICYDALMRYFFSAPTSWSLEVNSFLIVYMAVMGAAEAQREQAHIRIDLFPESCTDRGKAIVGILISVFGIVFCAIMTWRGFIMSSQALEFGERVSSSFGTPMFIPFALMPIGFGALGIQYLFNLVDDFNKLIKPDPRSEGVG